MRLVIVGCEYVGKTTLSAGITKWWKEQTGAPSLYWHDHFLVPHLFHVDDKTPAEEAQIESLMPSLLEKFQRYQIDYHFGPDFINDADHWLIDWFYAEAVYAPRYYGYGGRGEYADRRLLLRRWESHLAKTMPDTILVLMKASPAVIKQRMRENPHAKSFLKEHDVEAVLKEFELDFKDAPAFRRFVLDTSDATAEETLQEFVSRLEPVLWDSDRLRIISHRMAQV